MTYIVNEVFYTLQGEGFWTGRPAVFCRFSRCNLWTGREEDRATAICKFCDTDFLHGEKYEFGTLMGEIARCWGQNRDRRMVVFTGGEPTLQLDSALLVRLKERGFYTAIETNGTRPVPSEVDWVCVSPKAGALVKQRSANEVKLVYPQADMPPELAWALIEADHYWLSPMDGPDLKANTATAVKYVLKHPQWRLSIQTHKVVGVR